MSPVETNSERPNRQAQGLACDECRARKLRCDRVRPICGTCESFGIDCTPNTVRQPRGPRKGYLRTLQSRILALERQYSGPQRRVSPESPPKNVESTEMQEVHEGAEQQHLPPISNEQPTIPNTMPLEDLSTLAGPFPFNIPLSCPTNSSDLSKHADIFPNIGHFAAVAAEFDSGEFVPPPSIPNSTFSKSQFDFSLDLGIMPEFQIPELMKADMNHLFFDRVHLFAPILNKRRYFTRAARPMTEKLAVVCLQHAMWTLASWLGSQFKDIQKDLYVYTRGLLEKWELQMHPGEPPIELAQAWLLLAIYEIVQVNYERGWLSAGRCFRLVQLMKLHEIDLPNGIAESELSFADVEERRRTFWMAYSLDRFINLINEMPLTLNEQAIFTRLPASEAAFQHERPVKTQLLSEFMARDDDVQSLSPFSACIVLITVSGRCLSHRQQCIVETAYGGIPQDFLTRHQWLEGILLTKGKRMFDFVSADLDEELTDPMMLFTNMAAQATTLLLGRTMQSVLCNYESLISGFEERATKAAEKILHLCRGIEEYGHFKVHPFTPIPLMFCAQFAQERKSRNRKFENLFNSMVSHLRDLSVVSMLAEMCLARLNDMNPQIDTEIAKSQS